MNETQRMILVFRIPRTYKESKLKFRLNLRKKVRHSRHFLEQWQITKGHEGNLGGCRRMTTRQSWTYVVSKERDGACIEWGQYDNFLSLGEVDEFDWAEN
jgi:hypothetical protein